MKFYLVSAWAKRDRLFKSKVHADRYINQLANKGWTPHVFTFKAKSYADANRLIRESQEVSL